MTIPGIGTNASIPNRKNLALATALAALTALASLPAAASVITLQTRHSTAPGAPAGTLEQTGAYYRSLVEGLLLQAPGAGYCDTAPAAYLALENSSACGGSNTDIAFKFTVDFGISDAQAGTISFQVGPDFGKGGAVFLNGALLAASTTDLWWSGNYGAASEIFSLQNIPIGAGNHQLTVYGLQSAQYRLAGANGWTTLSTTDELKAVPEPLTAALVLAGLMGMVVAGRKRGR